MFLKSLILRGFKTFADQTEIEFAPDARITAIVGPNGCGKSNLMDATRWVLAEDNPRQLRVASLSDIIFAGTAAKKSLSLAEVTMVFDNASQKFPVPFAEVAIKRRTFREGESEFFINKNPCRLKDIKELLLDTGLGESTYSIITQGQVDAILSSKGEERRAVFEEAAGINKYKTRKYSAEKKLIAAEQNILRISDLKVEVGERIITLEEQAKAARHYLEVQTKVKELDLGLSKKLLTGILDKRKKLLDDLAAIQAVAQTKLAAETKDVNDLLALKERHRQLDLEIDQLAEKSEADKDLLRDLELERRFAESEHSRDEKKSQETASQLAESRAKIQDLNRQLEVEQKGLELSDLPLAKLFLNMIEQLSHLARVLSAALNQLGKNVSLNVELGRSRQKEETLKLKIDLLKEEETRLRTEEERLRFALRAGSSQLENLNQRALEAKNRQSPAGQVSQKRRLKEELAQKIVELEEKIRTDDQADREKLNQGSLLEIALAKLEGEVTGLCERLSLEYNLDLEALEKIPYDVPNIARAKKEIEEGRGLMRSLEPVNLLAIEEFDKETERLSFIEAQLADLNSARDNLRALITELDQKAIETFVSTMRQLSIIFSQTFAKLFVGGEAKITLTSGVSPLESEVEIEVRPSGRKWLPLPLLSGGERSLCAIAILFSLLKIRPSPFVFMDEVDAALDDANIGRFTGMLKDFAEHSQIIIITHNKQTMAASDNIYGVTMEEPGISKVISMKLAGIA